jgi:hypothetical protein
VGKKNNPLASRVLRWGIAFGCVIVVIVVVVSAADKGSDPAWYVNASPARETESPARETDSLPSSISGEEVAQAAGESRLSAASGPDYGSDALGPDPGDWKPILNEEALPCTDPGQPVNFETLSAGPSIDGLPLTHTERRCGEGGSPATRANYLSYIYGDCEIVEGATGCQPPLEIQTWPACQRFLAKYSFRGEPLPHERLVTQGDAEVVEFNFALDKRIEVYTGSSTVVIFAVDRGLAVRAVEMLRLEEEGKPPATHPDDLKNGSPGRLGPPAEGSLEGDLSC